MLPSLALPTITKLENQSIKFDDHTHMLENKAWNENTVLTLIADRQENPFTLKETTESLDADWEGTAEVLNQMEAFKALTSGW